MTVPIPYDVPGPGEGFDSASTIKPPPTAVLDTAEGQTVLIVDSHSIDVYRARLDALREGQSLVERAEDGRGQAGGDSVGERKGLRGVGEGLKGEHRGEGFGGGQENVGGDIGQDDWAAGSGVDRGGGSGVGVRGVNQLCALRRSAQHSSC